MSARLPSVATVTMTANCGNSACSADSRVLFVEHRSAGGRSELPTCSLSIVFLFMGNALPQVDGENSLEVLG